MKKLLITLAASVALASAVVAETPSADNPYLAFDVRNIPTNSTMQIWCRSTLSDGRPFWSRSSCYDYQTAQNHCFSPTIDGCDAICFAFQDAQENILAAFYVDDAVRNSLTNRLVWSYMVYIQASEINKADARRLINDYRAIGPHFKQSGGVFIVR